MGLYTYVSDLKFLKHVRGGVRSEELTEYILVKKVEFSLGIGLSLYLSSTSLYLHGDIGDVTLYSHRG